MYDIRNKSEAIRRIQKMLKVNESGIYDSKTRQKVTLHQELYSIEQSGVVDYITFLSILSEYNKNKIIELTNKNTPFTDGFPFRPGDSGDSITIINAMLKSAIEKYGLDATIPRGPFYSDATGIAVLELRRIFMLEEKNEIDEIFYDRLLSFSR